MISRRKLLDQWLEQRQPTLVELPDFEQLASELAPISESRLRRLLRESGAPLSPIVAGVDQSDLPSLSQSLTDLAGSYERGTAEQRRLCRGIVITAKDHARLASRNRRVGEEVRRLKAEMVEHMLIWLENPTAFPLWSQVRSSLTQAGAGY